jgi:hypothetical protein
LKSPKQLAWGKFIAGDSAVLAQTVHGNLLRWNLPQDHRDLNDLTKMAEMLSGQQLETQRNSERSSDLHSTWEHLHTRYAEEFSSK